MKRLITVIAIMLLFTGCSGKKDKEVSTFDEWGFDTDNLGYQMTLMQDNISDYYDEVKYSYNENDWTITETDTEIVLWTKGVTTKDDDKKKNITMIYTPVEKEKYKLNYLRIGEDTLFDDGTKE